MKELDIKAKQDNKIMKVLKVSELGHIVATTNKGPLVLRLIFGGTGRDYRFVLDAVPMEKDKNKELISLFYGE